MCLTVAGMKSVQDMKLNRDWSFYVFDLIGESTSMKGGRLKLDGVWSGLPKQHNDDSEVSVVAKPRHYSRLIVGGCE